MREVHVHEAVYRFERQSSFAGGSNGSIDTAKWAAILNQSIFQCPSVHSLEVLHIKGNRIVRQIIVLQETLIVKHQFGVYVAKGDIYVVTETPEAIVRSGISLGSTCLHMFMVETDSVLHIIEEGERSLEPMKLGYNGIHTDETFRCKQIIVCLRK